MAFLRRIFIITCSLAIQSAYAQSPLTETVQVKQSVLKMEINKGVKADDAIKALKSKAEELNTPAHVKGAGSAGYRVRTT